MFCSRVTSACLLALTMAACGDGQGSAPDASVTTKDAGSQQDAAADAAADAPDAPPDAGGEDPPGDGGAQSDAEAESDSGTCAESCVNGTCEGESCVCHAGFTGALCDALESPDTEGMLLWFDADHDDSFEIAQAQQVDFWTARHAVHGPVVASADADNHRPVRAANQLNGRPTVVFDGANDSLSTDGDGFTFWSGLEDVTGYTLFAVYQATLKSQIAFAALSNAHGLGIAVGTGGREGQVEALHGDSTAPAETFPLQLVSQDNAIVLTDYNLVVLQVTESAAMLRVNGEEVTSFELPDPIDLNIAQAVINLGVDSIFYPDPRHLGGGLAEIILYSGGLPPADVEHVETYLQAKWGLGD